MGHILDSHAADFPVIEKYDKIQDDVIKLEARNIANRDRKKGFREPNEQTDNKLFLSYNTNLGNLFEKLCAEFTAGLVTLEASKSSPGVQAKGME